MQHRFDLSSRRWLARFGLWLGSISVMCATGCGSDRFATLPVTEPNHTQVVELAPAAPRFAGRSYLGHPASSTLLPESVDEPRDTTRPIEVFATVDPSP